LYSILQAVEGYWYWRNVNPIFHKVPEEKVGGGGSQIWRSRRLVSGPPSADPSLRQLPVQEHRHLIVDVRWRSVTSKNIWFVLK
jgi:hypothetical protein